MLTIRKEQEAALGQAVEAEFGERLIDFLQEHFEEAAADPREVLRTEVRRMVRAARGYGLETEQQIAVYVITGALLSPEFATVFPDAHAILTSQMDPETKAARLRDWSQAVHAEVRR